MTPAAVDAIVVFDVSAPAWAIVRRVMRWGWWR
jgi:hypothetical protein